MPANHDRIIAPSYDFSLVRPRAQVLARADRELRADLVELRRSAGLTQAQLAERMGVSQQAIQKLERYDSDPKLSTLRRYANAVAAIVEHRVTRDTGQSRLLASPSRWEPVAVSTVAAPVALAASARDSRWVESHAARFALAG